MPSIVGDARTYSAALAEDNLGLPVGELPPSSLPEEVPGLVGELLRGSSPKGTDRPVLEESIFNLYARLKTEALEERGHFVRKAKWPGAKPFAACITHDVDNVRRPIRHVLERRSRFSASDLALALVGARSLYDNIGHVAELERRAGVRSTFYLLAMEYDLKALSRRASSLRDGGWEFGLHGDFGTHDSKEKMADAISRFEGALGFMPDGVREHFLKFDFSKTWKVLEESGFLYDTTLGNRDSLGFRVGLCSPFHPPDDSWRPMKIIELPLVLMDTTLWGYLKLEEGAGLGRAKEMLRTVSAVGGLFTLLWHQESVRMKGGRQFLPLLEHIAESGCFVAPAAEVARWWEARGAPLVREGDAYRISDAPRGLALELEAKEGMKPVVSGGTIERRGAQTFAIATSGKFELKFG